MNANFKVIGLTRIAVKPESTAHEADVLTTWPSEKLSLMICGRVRVTSSDFFQVKVRVRQKGRVPSSWSSQPWLALTSYCILGIPANLQSLKWSKTC